jgi:hypothetical protein
MKKLFLAMAVLLLLGMGGIAQAQPLFDVLTSVALVPNALNVTRGSTVDVSVDMNLPAGITMTAISTRILFDSSVFTYDDPWPVTQGGLLTHTWDLWGGNPTDGELRVGGIDLDFGESLAAGSGTLFTFTLKVKDNATWGASGLTWASYDGHDNALAGFDYGDAFVFDGEFWTCNDVLLLDDNMHGTSINVVPEVSEVPEPSSIIVLLCGLGSLLAFRRRRG